MIDWATAGKLKKMIRLLDEAYSHYYERMGQPELPGVEGNVTFEFGSFGTRQATGRKLIEIYSPVFCDGDTRVQRFDSVEDAICAVMKWHTKEMNSESKPFASEVLDALPSTGEIPVR